jgi:hypothetical protein
MNIQKYSKKIIMLAVATITFILATFVIYTPAYADVLEENECFPAVLMLKGSGEGIDENQNPVQETIYKPEGSGIPYIKTNGHEGATLGRLLQSFVNTTDPAKTVSKVRFVGIQYPALPVIPATVNPENTDFTDAQIAAMDGAIWINHIIQYNESYRIGAQMTLDFIKEDEQRGCNTQYMLLSYSQGVISARLVMNLLNNETDKVISSYVMGDPFQKANGAVSSRQKSIANTSSETMGVGRLAGESITGGADIVDYFSPWFKPFTNAAKNAISKYTTEITQADSFIYKDEGAGRIYSRSLCHKNDPTCGIDKFDEVDAEQHLIYFDNESDAGTIDIANEIAEFDKQVQTLANSTTSNPRERTLTKTPAILGQEITFNVANTRPDDVCSWDIGSDNTYEENGLCSSLSVSSSLASKITVKVTDSFGIEHIYHSQSEVIDPTEISKSLELDTSKWYQFKPKTELSWWPTNGYNDACLGVPDVSYKSLGYDTCANQNEYSNDNKNTVFKNVDYTSSQGSQKRLIWATDESLTMEAPAYSTLFWEALKPIDDISEQNINVQLISFVGNEPLYSIQQNKNQCLTVDPDLPWPYFDSCSSNNPNQLFTPTEVKDTATN